MGFINIILTFISALFWGVLAGLLTTGILIWLIHSLMNVPKIFLAIWGFLVLLFLSFQYTAWIGASKVKTYMEDVVLTVDVMQSFSITNKSDTTYHWENITEEYPMLKPFLQGTQIDYQRGEGALLSAQDLFTWIVNGVINAYMWRRFFWILGGIAVAVIGISFVRRPRKGNVSPSYNNRGGGTSTIKF